MRQTIRVVEPHISSGKTQKRLVHLIFQKLITAENLSAIPSSGLPEPDSRDDPIALELPNLYWTARILLRPDLMLGQCYVDGRWSVPPNRLFDFLRLIRSQSRSRLQHWFIFRNRFHLLRDAMKQRIMPIRSTRAVVEHYNTDAAFMEFILGPSLSYTCGLFEEENASLEEAQAQKIKKIVERASIGSGQRVLDLGTGWGYVPFPLARNYGCRVTGIAISKAQVEFCNQRKATTDEERLQFVHADYSKFEPSAPFDRVISVGMLEHVGRFQYTAFFDKIAQFLESDGIGLVHSLIVEREASPDAWIDRNVFPGGYIPTTSEVVSGVEASKCELLQLYAHPKSYYFRTLELWKQNLFENRSKCEARLAEIGLGSQDISRIIRIWEYFLSSSQIAFSEFGRCRTAQFVVRRKR